MRFPIFLACAWGFLLVGCGEAPEEVVTAPEQEALEPLPIPTTIPLNPAAQQLVDPWVEFRNWTTRLEVLLQAEEEEDLVLLAEELRELTKALEDSEFPAKVNRPAVRSRIKVVETFLIKLEADFLYRQDYRYTVKRIAEAYNALRGQLNRLPNMELDPKLFDR